jgi:hypothetical protein
VGKHRLAHGGVETVVAKGVLVGNPPEFARDEWNCRQKKPGGWFMSSGSRFGSPGPLVMS